MVDLLLKYLLPALGLLLSIGAAFTVGHSRGKAKADIQAAQQRTADNEAIAVNQINDARAAAAQTDKTIEVANNAQNSVVKLNDGDAAAELQSNWTRD